MFKVRRAVGSYVYEPELSRTIGIHIVFHNSLLDPAAGNRLPGPNAPPSPNVDINKADEYLIDDILDSDIYQQGSHAFVNLTGDTQPSWESHANIMNAE